MTTRSAFTLLAAATTCCTVFVAPAHAGPYSFGITQDFTADDNYLLVPKGSTESREVISSTGVVAGLDQPIGRQRLFGNLQAQRNVHKNFENLNNTSYSGALGLDWETVNELSGTLRASQSRGLYRDRTTLAGEANTQRVSDISATGRLGMSSLWMLTAGIAHREGQYTGESIENQDYKHNSGSFGVRYRPGGAISYGVGVSGTKGEYTNLAVPQKYTRKNLDFTTIWIPSGVTTLDTRLSYSTQTFDTLAARDFKALTGAMGLNWSPTGKLRVSARLRRDSNEGVTSLDEIIPDAISVDSRLINSANVLVRWLATSKINASVGVNYARRKLDSSFATGEESVTATDNTTGLLFGVNYAPTRYLSFNCGLRHENRSASGSTALTNSYRVNRVTCGGRFVID